MEATLELHAISGAGCDCCLTADEQGGSYTCADRSIVFTNREQDVLARIRSASARARSLRLDIEQLKAYPERRAEMERALMELAELRRERVSLEEERRFAADERMRLLGHA
ncbi:MAG: hypothetical protein AB9873_06395 [Syntrophobacteraceae bacterium]